MTKKDYELIAGAIFNKISLVQRENYSAEDALKLLAMDLGIRLGAQNPKFDRQRFLEACGVSVAVNENLVPLKKQGYER